MILNNIACAMSYQGIPVIPVNSLSVVGNLGSGAYGTVNSGLWNGFPVAIKTKKFRMSSENFIQEAKVMWNLRHDNLVKIYGIVFEEETHPVNGVPQVVTRIVMEYMCNGDLLMYFFFKQGQPILICDLLNMAKQIASFLAHMEFMGYVHGDLHPGNILVGKDGVCKVADLGQARHVSQSGYNAHRSNYPTAPELFARGGFWPTIETDVHSFGVLMHCIFTRGNFWYEPVESRPEGCPEDLFNMMQKCRSPDPLHRPSFREIQSFLINL